MSPRCIIARTRSATSPIRSRARSRWRARPSHSRAEGRGCDALPAAHRRRPRRDARARSASADVDDLFADVPPDKLLRGAARPAAPQERDRGRAACSAGMAAREHGGRVGAVLRRRRRLPPPRAGERRSPDPALGVPDLLHALPAGDRAGHAAIPVRVPDPGREAHRHGGGQRLDVRRLDRRRRGGADGAPPHQRRKAVLAGGLHPHYRDDGRDACRAWPSDEVVALPPRRRAATRTSRASIDDTAPASSCSRPTCSATSTTSRRSPRRRTRPARCSSPSSPRSCRSA